MNGENKESDMADLRVIQAFLVLAALSGATAPVSRREAAENMERIAAKMNVEDYLILFGATPVGRVRDMMVGFGEIRIEPTGYTITEKGRRTLEKLATHMVKEYGNVAYEWAGLHMG